MGNNKEIKWGRIYECKGFFLKMTHMKYVIPLKEANDTKAPMIWVYDLATAGEYKIYDFTLYGQYRSVK